MKVYHPREPTPDILVLKYVDCHGNLFPSRAYSGLINVEFLGASNLIVGDAKEGFNIALNAMLMVFEKTNNSTKIHAD